MSGKAKDEERLTLPVGHPQAGYVEPDLSYHEGTGVLPAEEIKIHEERNKARADEAEKIAANEDKVARAEHEARLAETSPKSGTTATRSSLSSSSS